MTLKQSNHSHSLHLKFRIFLRVELLRENQLLGYICQLLFEDNYHLYNFLNNQNLHPIYINFQQMTLYPQNNRLDESRLHRKHNQAAEKQGIIF